MTFVTQEIKDEIRTFREQLIEEFSDRFVSDLTLTEMENRFREEAETHPEWPTFGGIRYNRDTNDYHIVWKVG